LPRLKRIARQLATTDGAEILEAAVVLPLVFLFLLGIVEFGRAFNIYSTLQQAAQQGAITAARSACATCGDTAPLNSAVDTAVENVMQASNLNPSQIVDPTPPTPFSCVNPTARATCRHNRKITVCKDVFLNYSSASTQPPQCGTLVGVQYPFTFNLPFTSLNLETIILSAQAQSRLEN
jgi:Flp pilus assembly protein TadG